MRKPFILLLAIVAVASSLRAEDAPRPGLFKRSWDSAQFWKGWDWKLPGWKFGFGGDKQKAVRSKGLEMTMLLSPGVVRLSETRQIAVTIRLTNRSGRAVALQFPSTQRFDVWLHDGGGRTLQQWSEDESFEKEPVFVTINPHEFVEYTAKIATRDMKPGGLYVIQSSIVGQEGLSAEQTVMPQQ
jgi:hypothetical protein